MRNDYSAHTQKSGEARVLDPCHRPEGSWALGTRMVREASLGMARASIEPEMILLKRDRKILCYFYLVVQLLKIL